MTTENVLKEIVQERTYQEKKWGTINDDQNTSNDWVAYITRYAGTAYVYPFDKEVFRRKMVQVAALAVAAVEWVDRVNPVQIERFPNPGFKS